MAIRARSWILAVWVTVAVLCSSGGVAQAQSPDIGTYWDVSISGTTTGVGLLRFDSVSVPHIVEGLLAIKATPAPKQPNVPDPVLFGFIYVVGEWSAPDPLKPGHIVGSFSDESEELNMSFTGTVKTGIPDKIRLRALGNNGVMQIKGAPADNIDPIPASWTAIVTKTQDATTAPDITEFFDLEAGDICLDGILLDPGICGDVLTGHFYGLAGAGPDYDTEGIVMVGAGQRMALILTELGGLGRGVTGKYKIGTSTTTASLKGSDEDEAIVKMKITGP